MWGRWAFPCLILCLLSFMLVFDFSTIYGKIFLTALVALYPWLVHWPRVGIELQWYFFKTDPNGVNPSLTKRIIHQKVLEQPLPVCWTFLWETCNRSHRGDEKAELHSQENVSGARWHFILILRILLVVEEQQKGWNRIYVNIISIWPDGRWLLCSNGVVQGAGFILETFNVGETRR